MTQPILIPSSISGAAPALLAQSEPQDDVDKTEESIDSVQASSKDQGEGFHRRGDQLVNFESSDQDLQQLDLSTAPQPGGFYSPDDIFHNAAGPADQNASIISEPLDYHGAVQVHPDIVIPSVIMVRLRKPPQKYKLLVRVLERERLQGNTRVVFSQLGSMLRAEHPSVYQRAGAHQLKDYIAMADKDGIVIVGRNDWENGNRWVALHPTYHGKPPELVPVQAAPQTGEPSA